MGQGRRPAAHDEPASRWYRGLVRPLFFALPPETAHRLAHRLLALPLPWERIGAAVRDPALAASVAGLSLPNPIGLAAGFDKTGERVGALGRLGFGYVVCGTFTRRPRSGHPRPTIARSPRRAAMVNAMGLPNPGAEAAARALAERPRTAPTFASLADEEVDDVLESHALLEPHVDAFELNASCPNVSWGRDRDQETHLRTLVTELAARSSRPLAVKLPPFRTEVERAVVLALARIAREAGADALTCSNTVPVADRRLSVGAGGLSGRPLLDDTVAAVRAVRAEVGAEVPIHASGGVFTPADALACIGAGASTVQVYTGLVFRGPRIVGELTAGLLRALHERRVDLVSLVGAG